MSKEVKKEKDDLGDHDFSKKDFKVEGREVRPDEQILKGGDECDICHGSGFASGFLLLPCPRCINLLG